MSKPVAFRFPPPLIALLTALPSFALQSYFPLALSSSDWPWWLGLVFLGLALGIALVSVATLYRARTAIEPWKPTRCIVSHGMFAISRNPIYLSFVMATLGAGLVLNNGWLAISCLLVAWVLQVTVIKAEERYLSQYFGAEYSLYLSQVRRWI